MVDRARVANQTLAQELDVSDVINQVWYDSYTITTNVGFQAFLTEKSKSSSCPSVENGEIDSTALVSVGADQIGAPVLFHTVNI